MLCQPLSPREEEKVRKDYQYLKRLLFNATNDPSVAELEDLRVEDENEVGTSETALDTIP